MAPPIPPAPVQRLPLVHLLRRAAVLGALLLAVGMAGWASAQETRSGGGRSTPTRADGEVRLVAIHSVNGCQMDVWIDGRQVGQTPIRTRLRPGFIVLTAGTEGLEPVIIETEVFAEVPPGTMQTILLDDRVMEIERFPLVFRQLVVGMQNHPTNAHIKIMATLLTQEKDDYENLKRMIPVEHLRDPHLLVAEAGWLARDGDLEGALGVLEQAGEINPGLSAVWRAQARILYRMGNLDDAAILAGRAVIMEQANPQNYRTRALIADAANQTRAAELDREEARSLEDAMEERLEETRRQRMLVR